MATLICYIATILLATLVASSFTLPQDEKVEEEVIPYPNPEEGNKFEGDIILDPDQMLAVIEQDSKRAGSQFAAIRARNWKANGMAIPIPYYINPALGYKAKSAIKAAVSEYIKHTCIKFQEVDKRPLGKAHLHIVKKDGCWSHVGMYNNHEGQELSIGKGCEYKGVVTHEFGHALGLFHEQSRPDRDNYVEIILNNITPGMAGNFKRYSTTMINSLGFKYDYESIMHYTNTAFAKRAGLITIRTKNPAYQNKIGNRNVLSKGDIAQLNKMYCSKLPCYNLESAYQCWLWRPLCKVNSGVKRRCRVTCKLC